MRNPMFVFDERTTDLVLSYCRERLALDPVPLDYGGYATDFSGMLDGVIGAGGNDVQKVLDLFAESLSTAVVSIDSPRFLSFIPAAPTKAALLFDMVVSCSSLNGTSWLLAAGVVAAENQALGILAELAGLPPEAGGTFVSGGSAANLSALLVARDTAQAASAARPAHAAHGTRPRIALSAEAHSSVTKAVHILGADAFVVPTPDHRLTGECLERALDASRHDGGGPVVAVVATAGTTNAGIVDDMASTGEVAHGRGIWFHVDAAYGGAALFSPAARPRFDGIELADSVAIDPHKWLFAPYDCAALLYRDPTLAKAVHTQDAAYLSVFHTAPRRPGQPPAGGRGGGEDPWNPTDYAFHLSRRSRGMPLWFSLAVHGTDAYRDAVEAALTTAKEAAALVGATPYTELVREPELSIVLFRRTGWTHADYDAWSAKLLADQIALCVPTTWEGEPTARLALLHPETTLAIVRQVLDSMA
ncbi:MAG TPA: pyridoxal-dependent decarboxylase [Acidimicrobiales bacterium]|nr:pyridoxal-dependent decarboxylase [Acidimicrobiales bacterium]